MIEDVRIRITGDAKELESTVTQLEKLGKVDRANSDQFKKHNSEHKAALKETGGEVDRLENRFRSLGERVIAAFAIERIIEFTKGAVDAFAAAELQANKLQFAITKINGESKESFKGLIEQSEKLSKSLNNLFTPRQIQSAQTQLANFGLTSEMIKKLIPRVLDMSRATGKDLTESVEKSILAINGQTKGLRDVGITFKDTGSKTENFNKLLGDMDKFSGAAADSLATVDGQMKSMEGDIEVLKESIGSKLAGAFVTLEDVALNSIQGIIDSFQQLFDLQALNVGTIESFTGFSTEQAKVLDKLGLSVQGNTAEWKKFAKTLLDYDEVTKMTVSAIQEHIKFEKQSETATKAKTVELARLGTAFRHGKIDLETYTNEVKLLNDAFNNFQPKKLPGPLNNDATQAGIDAAAAAKKKALEELAKLEKQALDALIKLNEEMQKQAKQEADDLRKMQEEQKTATEKETDFHKLRLDNLTKFLSDGLIDQKQYDSMKEKEEERHQKEMMRIEAERTKQGDEMRAKAEESRKKQEEQANKDREAVVKATEEAQKKSMENMKAFVDQSLSSIEKNIENTISNIDHLKSLQQASIDQQTQLAIAGKQNDLAFEISQNDKLEKERLIQQKKLKKAKELEIFLNAVANFSKDSKSPGEAITKAIAEVALVKTVEAVYGEKGALLGQGGERSTVSMFGASRRHASGNDILIHAEKGEGLLSKGEVKALGGSDGFFMLKAALAQPMNQRKIPLTAVMGPGSKSDYKVIASAIREEMEDFFNNNPITTITGDELGNIIETRERNGVKDITKHILRKIKP